MICFSWVFVEFLVFSFLDIDLFGHLKTGDFAVNRNGCCTSFFRVRVNSIEEKESDNNNNNDCW